MSTIKENNTIYGNADMINRLLKSDFRAGYIFTAFITTHKDIITANAVLSHLKNTIHTITNVSPPDDMVDIDITEWYGYQIGAYEVIPYDDITMVDITPMDFKYSVLDHREHDVMVHLTGLTAEYNALRKYLLDALKVITDADHTDENEIAVEQLLDTALIMNTMRDAIFELIISVPIPHTPTVTH